VTFAYLNPTKTLGKKMWDGFSNACNLEVIQSWLISSVLYVYKCPAAGTD